MTSNGHPELIIGHLAALKTGPLLILCRSCQYGGSLYESYGVQGGPRHARAHRSCTGPEGCRHACYLTFPSGTELPMTLFMLHMVKHQCLWLLLGLKQAIGT